MANIQSVNICVQKAAKDRRRNNWRIVAEASRLSSGAGRPSYDSYSFADPKPIYQSAAVTPE